MMFKKSPETTCFLSFFIHFFTPLKSDYLQQFEEGLVGDKVTVILINHAPIDFYYL